MTACFIFDGEELVCERIHFDSLEFLVNWAYNYDASLRLPYRDNLSALLHEPTFKAAAGQAVLAKALLIKDAGNDAVHSRRPFQESDALAAVRDLFHVSYWLAHTYARQPGPAPGLAPTPGWCCLRIRATSSRARSPACRRS